MDWIRKSSNDVAFCDCRSTTRFNITFAQEMSTDLKAKPDWEIQKSKYAILHFAKAVSNGL